MHASIPKTFSRRCSDGDILVTSLLLSRYRSRSLSSRGPTVLESDNSMAWMLTSIACNGVLHEMHYCFDVDCQNMRVGYPRRGRGSTFHLLRIHDTSYQSVLEICRFGISQHDVPRFERWPLIYITATA